MYAKAVMLSLCVGERREARKPRRPASSLSLRSPPVPPWPATSWNSAPRQQVWQCTRSACSAAFRLPCARKAFVRLGKKAGESGPSCLTLGCRIRLREYNAWRRLVSEAALFTNHKGRCSLSTYTCLRTSTELKTCVSSDGLHGAEEAGTLLPPQLFSVCRERKKLSALTSKARA